MAAEDWDIVASLGTMKAELLSAINSTAERTDALEPMIQSLRPVRSRRSTKCKALVQTMAGQWEERLKQ
eukprot:1838328-Pyramimonas_sp.AAC.1